MKLLSPREFVTIIGEGALVTSRAALPPTLPSDATTFLKEAGLPKHLICGPEDLRSVISFIRLRSGATPALEEPTVGPALPTEFAAYWIIGDEVFINGSAWFCITGGTGQLVRIDVERDDPVEFVNSSVKHFATFLAVLQRWCADNDGSDSWGDGVHRIQKEMFALEPEIASAPKSFWPRLLEAIEEEGPETFQMFHSDPSLAPR